MSGALLSSLWLIALRVALIAGGANPEANDHSHLLHLQALKDSLESMGVPSDRVTVFWADGVDEALDRRLPGPGPDAQLWATTHTPWQLWFERPIALTDTRWQHPDVRPARRAALRGWFQELSPKMKPGEQLLIAVTDHGRPDPSGGWKTSIDLWGETWSVPQLYEDLKLIPKGVTIQLWMSQCFSGGFATLSTLDSRVCGAFSAEPSRPAYGCFSSQEGAKGGEALRGHFVELLKGFKGEARLDLASDYAMEHDDTPDTPHLSSDAFIRRLAQERAEAMGVPVSYLIDAGLPSTKALSPERRGWARRISQISVRYGLGSVHSSTKARELYEELQKLQYTLSAWHAKWAQLTLEAKLRLLTEAPVDGAPPKEIARRRRGLIRLKRWLKSALKRGREGRRGLLRELYERQLKSERLMDQLFVLEAATLRIEALYMRLAAESLLNPHDLELWERMRRCEAKPIAQGSGRAPRRRRLSREPVAKGLSPLVELRAEVEALRPGSLGLMLHERSSGKRATVTDIAYGSPAWLYDLKPQDQITSVDGRRLSYEGQLREQVALYPVGESISLKRKRRGARERLLHVPVIGAPLSPAPPKPGDQVPPLPLEPIYEGESLDYLFVGGRPSLLFFWATWCEACLRAAPQVQRWAKRHDLQVLAITSEDPNLVRAVMPKSLLSFPTLYDPGLEASRLFHVDLQRTQAPIFVYLDVERRFIEQGVGLGEEGPAQIEALFND